MIHRLDPNLAITELHQKVKLQDSPSLDLLLELLNLYPPERDDRDQTDHIYAKYVDSLVNIPRQPNRSLNKRDVIRGMFHS